MDRRVVTPEAVALDLQTATVATRGLAALLDVFLQGLAALLVLVGVGVVDVDTSSGAVFVTVILLAVLLIRIAYPVVMETRFGATVGHLAMGLRVVTLDGAPIRARQAVARVAVGLFEIDMTLGSLALLVAASREDGRRLGDLAAGTQVVSVRSGSGPAVALDLRVPPHLEGWAASLDPTGLAQPERVALRRYLARAAELPPARRDQLAAGLADRLLPRVAAAQPANASVHEVLVAIAATVTRSVPSTRSSPSHPSQPPPPAAPAPPAAAPWQAQGQSPPSDPPPSRFEPPA